MLTLLLIAITAIISFYAFQNTHIYYRFMMNPYSIYHRKEYFRFLTSGFIHNGHVHLIFNMFTLFFFGRWIEYYFVGTYQEIGYFYYLLIYIGGIIVSDIPTYQRFKNAPHYNSLGASGGVSSLILASVLYNPLEELCMYGFICLPAFLMGGIYMVYSYVYSKDSPDNINHSAHLVGALFGLVVAAALRPSALAEFFIMVGQYRPFE